MRMQIIFFNTGGDYLVEVPFADSDDTVPSVHDRVKFLNGTDLLTGTVQWREFEYLPELPDRPALVNLFLTLTNVHGGLTVP